MGEPITAVAVDAKLSTGEFDVVTLVHNETSTGVMNPLEEIAAVVRNYPDVLLVVDTVSSFSAVPIKADEWGSRSRQWPSTRSYRPANSMS